MNPITWAAIGFLTYIFTLVIAVCILDEDINMTLGEFGWRSIQSMIGGPVFAIVMLVAIPFFIYFHNKDNK